jgi:hypothetical protein
MSGVVSWAFKLLDQASGPASTIEKKLANLEKRIQSLNKAEASLNGPRKDAIAFRRLGLEMQLETLKATQKTAEATDGWLSKLEKGLVSGYLVGKAVWGMASGAVHAAKAFGGLALDAAGFKESTMAALNTLTRSEAASERIFASGIKLAAETPYETKEVLGWQKQLLTGGFSESELPVLLKAVGDVGALHNFDREIIDRVFRGLVKVKARGKLTGELMDDLGSILPTAKIYETLGNLYGKKSKDEVLKMQAAGKINADDALFAIIGTIKEQLSGGELGKLQDEMAKKTLAGTWSTLSSRPFEWFLGFEKTKGYQALKKAISVLADGLDPLAEKGGRLARSLQGVADSMLSVFSPEGIDGAKMLDRFLSGATNALDMIGAAIRGLGQGFLQGFVGSLDGMSDIFDGKLSPEQLSKITDAFTKMGEAFGWAAAGLTKMVDAAYSLTSLLGGANWDKDTSSGRFLSKLFPEEQKGWFQSIAESPFRLVEGLASIVNPMELPDVGIRPGTGVLALPPAPIMASFSPGARSQEINVTVHAPGATPEAAHQIGKVASESVRDAGAALICSEAMSCGAQ